LKVLISGLNGFLGSNLQRHRLSSHDFKYLSRTDILDSDYKIDKNIDVIIHLAGKAHDLKNNVEFSDYNFSNYKLTKLLYDKFLKSSCKKFIFMSTVKACCDESNDLLTENIDCQPSTFYGKSKLKAENYIINNINNRTVYILRPTMIYGSSFKGNLNLLYKFCKLRLPWPLYNYENKRSYCSVMNLSFIINKLIDSKNIPYGIYNVCDDDLISTNQLVFTISKALNYEIKMLKIPRFFIDFFVKAGDFFKLPINSSNFNKLTGNFMVSNKKIKNAFGLDEMPLKTLDGIFTLFKNN
jgi:nucleoside-diphosphate-sugar epimerase